jgi:RimJ/RimL family protein N-acetyltransferase
MTTGVALREVTDEDLEILYLQQLDDEARRMAAFPLRELEAFLAHWNRIRADSGVVKRVIAVGGAVAGYVVSFEMSGERQIGYWVGREYWGQGIATRALGLFLAVEPARPLHAHVAKHNVGSRRVLEKCGFTIEREVVGGDGVEEQVLVLPETPTAQGA